MLMKPCLWIHCWYEINIWPSSYNFSIWLTAFHKKMAILYKNATISSSLLLVIILNHTKHLNYFQAHLHEIQTYTNMHKHVYTVIKTNICRNMYEQFQKLLKVPSSLELGLIKTVSEIWAYWNNITLLTGVFYTVYFSWHKSLHDKT